MNFTSQEDLEQCLLSSCAVFPFARLVYHRGQWNIDGGLTDFVPPVYGDDVHRGTTVTVSPFYFSQSDIKPSRYVPFWWAIVPPSSPETIDWLYALGYEDAVCYIRKHAKMSLTQCVVQRPDVSYRLSAMKPLSSAAHSEYGAPRNITMSRLLGYPLPNHWVSYLLDGALLVALLVIWKPLILTLIYIELVIRVVARFAHTLYVELVDWLSPVTVIVGAVFLANQVTLLTNMTLMIYLRKLLTRGPANMQYYTEMWHCLVCLTSPSLFIRYVSGRPSAALPDAHDILERVSVVYRVFKYVI